MRRPIKRPQGVIVGLDLSLRAAAACSIPMDWEQDLTRVRTAKFGSALHLESTPRDRIERMIQIAHDVSLFCITVRATSVAVEAYAFGMRSSSSHQLAELGGVVKARLLDELDLATQAIVASQARKTLLQRLPRKGIKKYVMHNVRRLGSAGGPVAEWSEDEIDAFVIANHLLMLSGGVAMTFEGVK